MSDQEIIEALIEAQRAGLAPTALAAELQRLLGEKLTHSYPVTFFKRAFPRIPLRSLLEAGLWNALNGGGLSDEEFNALVAPWLLSPAGRLAGTIRQESDNE